jgi:hypothetical protein
MQQLPFIFRRTVTLLKDKLILAGDSRAVNSADDLFWGGARMAILGTNPLSVADGRK